MSTNYNPSIVSSGLILHLDAANKKSYPFDWTKTVFITTTESGTFTVPSDFYSLVSIEAIGAGAGVNSGGTGGSGGGAYAKSTSVTGLIAGGTAYYYVPPGTTNAAGGDTWFNAVSNLAPTLSSQGVLAKGGSINASTLGGIGGQASSCIGDIKFSGGNGGAGSAGVGGTNGGGGAAAGPLGAGGTGGASVSNGGGGGGGANGGLNGGDTQPTSGGVGGNSGNNYDSSGGAGSTASSLAIAGNSGGGGGGGLGALTYKNGAVGGNGNIWSQTSNGAFAGPGGGSGAGTGGAGSAVSAGGLYGGGMGNGGSVVTLSGQGIIVFTYIDKTTGWKDTTTNNYIGSLIGGPTHSTINGGTFIFDGSSKRTTISSPIGSTGTITASVWYRRDDAVSATNYRTILGDKTANIHQLLCLQGSYTLGIWDGEFKSLSFIPPTDGLFHNYTLVYNSNKIVSLYVDGVYTSQVLTVLNLVTNPIGSIGNWNSGDYWAGYIANVSFYNRGLMDFEIKQNFNALRGRYGL